MGKREREVVREDEEKERRGRGVREREIGREKDRERREGEKEKN